MEKIRSYRGAFTFYKKQTMYKKTKRGYFTIIRLTILVGLCIWLALTTGTKDIPVFVAVVYCLIISEFSINKLNY